MTISKIVKLTATLVFCLAMFAAVPELQAQPKKKDIERAKKIAKAGDQFYNRKNYRAAIERYAEAVTIVPQFPEAYFWKGWSHYYLNENDQAIADLTMAEKLGFPKPFEFLKLRWFLHYQAKNYDAAMADVTAALRIEPNNSTLAIGAGDINMSRQRWQDAVPYYQKALELDRNNSEVAYQLARCYYNLGRADEQFAAATDALKRRTRFVGESNFLIGDALLKLKKTDEAIEYLERAVDIRADQYEAYGLLAEIYRGRNDFEKAIATARKGLLAFPNDATLYTSLAWYYSLADKPKEAIIAAKSAITIKPDLAMAYTNLCRAYNDAGEYQNSVTACNNALKINPGDGETYFYIARAYEFLKQSDKSIDAYRKAADGLAKFTAANPESWEGFYLLGNSYFALSKDNDAINAYNRCIALTPKFAKARYNLGQTYVLSGDKAKAREQLAVLRGLDANLAEKLRVAIEK